MDDEGAVGVGLKEGEVKFGTFVVFLTLLGLVGDAEMRFRVFSCVVDVIGMRVAGEDAVVGKPDVIFDGVEFLPDEMGKAEDEGGDEDEEDGFGEQVGEDRMLFGREVVVGLGKSGHRDALVVERNFVVWVRKLAG